MYSIPSFAPKVFRVLLGFVWKQKYKRKTNPANLLIRGKRLNSCCIWKIFQEGALKEMVVDKVILDDNFQFEYFAQYETCSWK